MPNHVHVLVSPRAEWTLESVLHSWKSYTAKEINRQPGQQGVFWVDETFDHMVRSAAQLLHFRNYIRENAAKARLSGGEFTLWEREGDTGVPPVHSEMGD